MQVQYREEYKSFTHFLTSVCAIVGGVFTVSGLIDSFIYHGQKVRPPFTFDVKLASSYVLVQ